MKLFSALIMFWLVICYSNGRIHIGMKDLNKLTNHTVYYQKHSLIHSHANRDKLHVKHAAKKKAKERRIINFFIHFFCYYLIINT